MFGRGGRKTRARIEPRLDWPGGRREDEDDLRADPADRPPQVGRQGRRNPAKAPARGKKGRKSPRFGSLLGRLAYWGAVAAVWMVVALAGVFAYYASQLPPIDQLAVPKRPPNIAILADDGTLLVNRGDSGGPAVRLIDLPPYLPKAFIAIEDRRFYSHYGVDPLGIARALVRDIAGRGAVEGGSTLTQQLAKNLFLTQERTLSRKIQEAILAVWLERRYSKDQILELYLNRVYFGSGAYGVEGASQKYFGKSARFDSLSEAALLAGLMKSPSKLAPTRNPAGAAERATQVITAMAEQGHITEAQAKMALANPGPGVARQDRGLDQLRRRLRDGRARRHGRRDRRGHRGHDHDQRRDAGRGGARARRRTHRQGGEVRRRAGGAGGARSDRRGQGAGRRQELRREPVQPRRRRQAPAGLVVQAVRLPGGAGKGPDARHGARRRADLGQWLEPGELQPRIFRARDPDQGAVAVAEHRRGAARPRSRARRRCARPPTASGITSELEPNATIALGTSAVAPLEMASAYAAFANGGVGVQPHVITKVRTADGKLLYTRRNANFGRVIEPQYVAMMNTMMQETLLTGTARKAELPGWQAAGKTGTSQDFRDAWFVGYTSYLVTAVWLGNDDDSPTKKVSGGNLPVEVWSRFMKAAHQGVARRALAARDLAGRAVEPVRAAVRAVRRRRRRAAAAARADPAFRRPGRRPAHGAAARRSTSLRPPPRPAPAGRGRPAPAASDAPVPPANVPDAEPGRKTNAFLDKIFGNL